MSPDKKNALHTQYAIISSMVFYTVKQGCGNTMPDLSNVVPFHSGQVRNFYKLVLGQVQIFKESLIAKFCISYLMKYYELTCCIENSVDPDQLPSSEAS